MVLKENIQSFGCSQNLFKYSENIKKSEGYKKTTPSLVSLMPD